MAHDYFSISADVRPSIRHNKPKKDNTAKKQREEVGERALLVKLYQARILSGRDIWTGDFIKEDQSK